MGEWSEGVVTLGLPRGPQSAVLKEYRTTTWTNSWVCLSPLKMTGYGAKVEVVKTEEDVGSNPTGSTNYPKEISMAHKETGIHDMSGTNKLNDATFKQMQQLVEALGSTLAPLEARLGNAYDRLNQSLNIGSSSKECTCKCGEKKKGHTCTSDPKTKRKRESKKNT